MPRLSITLTESQAEALERIAAETGATKQSMIGLAVSAWIRANGPSATAPQAKPQGQAHPEEMLVVTRGGVEVGWYRGRLETGPDGARSITFTAHRLSRCGALQELPRPMAYEVTPDEDVRAV